MIWAEDKKYYPEEFESENDLEKAITETSEALFGLNRFYLDIKKKIGKKGDVQNIPDGYLLDLSSNKEPKLYLVEVELMRHDPLKHIAVQILEFSLSFETTPLLIKQHIKDALLSSPETKTTVQQYADQNGYDNIDVLLEKMIYGFDKFNALVIIDELPDNLNKILISRFHFPVEILIFERYRATDGACLYKFEPFLNGLNYQENKRTTPIIDPSDIDTVIVPAREDGFKETFLGENCWYAIRMHASMKSKIKYIAAYQVAPESAITYYAPVASIEPYKDTDKYIVTFASPAQKIVPIKLTPNGKVKAPQAPRYTSKTKLLAATNLDEVF